MSKTIGLENGERTNLISGSHVNHKEIIPAEVHLAANDSVTKNGPTESERELLDEVLRAVRTIHYGSVVLTIHDSRLVEISKTIRLRKNAPSRKE